MSELNGSIKLLAGFLVAFAIGAFCRVTNIPSPAPRALPGSLLVVMMSLGYIVAGQIIQTIELLQFHISLP